MWRTLIDSYSSWSNESVYVVRFAGGGLYEMFEELDEAIEMLGATTLREAWSAASTGNIAQWLKYANSLKFAHAHAFVVVSRHRPCETAEAIAGSVIKANADVRRCAAENSHDAHPTTGATTVSEPTSSATDGYKDRVWRRCSCNDVGDYVGIRIGIDVTSKSQPYRKYSI
ncbi:MAG: SusD/RagB family nutrient-binding outer membrane lipoprotein [Alistipes shahii]